jgi:hypothetical protein
MANRVAPQLIHRLLFGSTIFVGAFLLFQVQPLISKYILPWYGGTPAVWTTALLFFQVFLVGGYAYAHLSVRLLPPGGQTLLHLLLLLGAGALLPISPAVSWKPSTAIENPTGHILVLLAVNVGMAYFMLASTSPLLQAWFSRANPGRSPYRFYALSNVGSLLALLSYPILVEPALTLRAQVRAWSGIFVVFAVGSAAVAVWAWRHRADGATEEQSRPKKGKPAPAPTPSDWLLWLAFPAAASILLLATTNQMTQQVAVVPFLWVVPLSLYLVTFILCFEGRRFYIRVVFIPALVVALLALVHVLDRQPSEISLPLQIGVYSVFLFICCMVCHGELVRRKPHPAHLTAFYLMISIGGALGGIFVALIAPRIFKSFLELHVGALLTCGLLLLALFAHRERSSRPGRAALGKALLGVVFLGVGIALVHQAVDASEQRLGATRNFYGILWVKEVRTGDLSYDRDILYHGEIRHGNQYIAPALRCMPTSYFAPMSGVGMTIRSFPRQDQRIGVVGLGIGVLAGYAGPDDYMRFYEINPDVKRIAEERFSFVTECGKNVDVVLGDARLSLEREASQQFDILVLDAFRGDALPVHLLTVEAFETYLRHLKPDGVIAAHISSLHFNLKPVFWRMADHFGLDSLVLLQPQEDAEVRNDSYQVKSSWMLMSDNAELMAALPQPPPGRLGPGERAQLLVDPAKGVAYVAFPEEGDDKEVRLWTDDYSNPFQMLKWSTED